MTTVNNNDIIGLYDPLNKLIVEVNKTVSSDLLNANEFDQPRGTNQWQRQD